MAVPPVACFTLPAGWTTEQGFVSKNALRIQKDLAHTGPNELFFAPFPLPNPLSSPLPSPTPLCRPAPAVASRATKFRIVGPTLDIQALTPFMKTLEASPFIQGVQLTRSDMVTAEGKEVTEFQLEAGSQGAQPGRVKPVALPGRCR